MEAEPDISHLRAVVDQIKAESDRAAVVLSGAAMDAALLQILKAHLRPVPTGDDKLLESDGALGTFSARITLAHRLGLIDDVFAAVLHLFRRIRNEFAHESAGHTLADSPHRERVFEIMKRLARAQKRIERISGWFPSATGPALHFRVAAAMTIVALDTTLEMVEPVHLTQQRYIPFD